MIPLAPSFYIPIDLVILSDIIGQPRALQAIRIALSSPTPSALLISGSVGTGKSTILGAVRSLSLGREIVSLPATLSVEELSGQIDLGLTLEQARPIRRIGVLERLVGSVVLIDNVGLMQPEVLRQILDWLHDPMLSGGCTLLGAINPEEGGLPTSLLDRFDLYVPLDAVVDLPKRVQIMRQGMLRPSMAESDSFLSGRILHSRARIRSMLPSPADYEIASELCREAFVLGHRADVSLLRAAMVVAVEDERDSLILEDYMAVKEFVLSHRMNSPRVPEQSPPPPSEASQKSSDETPPQEPKADVPPPSREGQSGGGDSSQGTNPLHSLEDAPSGERWDQGVELSLGLDPITALRRQVRLDVGFGSRVRCSLPAPRGRYIRSTRHNKPCSDVALLATIQQALAYQPMRQKKRDRSRHQLVIMIEPSDLCYKRRHRRTGYHILFVVDASGSMGAQRRMMEVKGLVLELLREAYVQRDYVGMITFRRDEAETILPFTRSVAQAYRLLEEIRTGGRTPLYLGLLRATERVEALARQGRPVAPIVVLVTDGRATSRYTEENSPTALAALSRRLLRQGARLIVVDSETGYVRMRRAEMLAHQLQADAYHRLDDLIFKPHNNLMR